ncbi:MAG TPA: hypothetical protein VIT22_00630 [Pseudoxanthomonas sp.]
MTLIESSPDFARHVFARRSHGFQQPNGWSSGNPATLALNKQPGKKQSRWVPAFAGMTNSFIQAYP